MSEAAVILAESNEKLGVAVLLIVLGEILMGYLAYRRAKANGSPTDPAAKAETIELYVPKPLQPNATRIEKIAHWLGLEETAD